MIRILLLILAILCFLGAATGLLPFPHLLEWGLAFGFASFLPWKE